MKKKIIVISLFVIIIFIGFLYYFLNKDKSNKIYGNVDIRESFLSFEMSGTIDNILVDEGDRVKKGDILCLLNTNDLNYQINIKKENCGVYKAKYDEMQNGYLENEIIKAKNEVLALESAYNIAKITSQRQDKLYKNKATSKQIKDEAFFNMTKAYASLQSAKNTLKLLEDGYRDEEIKSAEHSLNGCLNELEYLKYQKDVKSVLKAPYDGLIRTRLHEIGDYTSPNNVVLTITDDINKIVRAYVGETNLSKIKIGDTVRVETTTSSLTGTVSFINNTAMFTPKTVQTEDLRSDLVYEIKINVLDNNQLLKFGQACTVYLDNEHH